MMKSIFRIMAVIFGFIHQTAWFFLLLAAAGSFEHKEYGVAAAWFSLAMTNFYLGWIKK